MKVLVTGANGFVGYYLVEQLLAAGFNVIATGKGECRLPFSSHKNFVYAAMDFTDPFSVHDTFETFKPEAVVHAGAMSKPDVCEKEQWKAYVTNVEGTLNLLSNAEELKSFFVFISSDFVFDGLRGMYTEEDEANPVNFYGETKRDAELAVKEYPFAWSIVRTVFVYGRNHSNHDSLLNIIKNKLQNGESFSVFNDQVRTPTYVEDLATAIVTIIKKNCKGIYHVSGKDIMTVYEMAKAAADYLQLDSSLLKKITAEDLSQPARRPAKTGFDISKAEKDLGFTATSFADGLKKTFN